MIGVCRLRSRSRISAAVWNPSSSGIWMSSRMRAKSCASSCRSASWPDFAVISFCPSGSSIASRASRPPGSLSTRRMLTVSCTVWTFSSESLNVELRIMSEDAVLIEGDAALGREISGNARPRRDAAVKRDRPGVFRLQPLHRPGKSIAQTRDHLEKRKVRVGKRLAEEPAAFFPHEHALEVAEEFREALGGEVRGAALRFGLLVLVVEGAPDRVVGVVRFDQPVADGELELVCPDPGSLAFRHEAVARGEPEEDVRSLRDHQLPRFEERRCEGRALLRFASQELHHRRHALLRKPRDVQVIGPPFLKSKSDEFSAALYRRPVIELVAHGSSFKTCQASRGTQRRTR